MRKFLPIRWLMQPASGMGDANISVTLLLRSRRHFRLLPFELLTKRNGNAVAVAVAAAAVALTKTDETKRNENTEIFCCNLLCCVGSGRVGGSVGRSVCFSTAVSILVQANCAVWLCGRYAGTVVGRRDAGWCCRRVSFF